jgi:CRP-like cAMP-binding protein
MESNMIPESVFRKHHASLNSYKKGEFIFHQGEEANHFHIVKSGRVKMANFSDTGKEFVQGYFTAGQSFGEPPFFCRMPYPASAIAIEASKVWICAYDDFMELLKKNFQIHLSVTQTLCGRLVYKSMMLSEIANEEAEHRISTLIRYWIKERGAKGDFTVPFTRQQIADMTGLRVETVIRSIKSLEQKRMLNIDKQGKILWKLKQPPPPP